MNIKNKSKQGFMSIKLDMNKADDHSHCDYLEHTLVVMGFPPHFTYLIMQCVGSTSFSIFVNRVFKGPIIPSMRLRQGDPLSPYFFVLCTEGLVSLLRQADLEGNLRGIWVCRGALPINHLLFVNDSLIFYKVERNSST